ncbi:unnamed protein product [Parajaminaea phylloscopi]
MAAAEGAAGSGAAATTSSFAPRTFDRVDSRGECQLAAAPPHHVLAGLQSVGMKARMSVGRGYTASTVERPGSSLPPRSAFARTQSMPVAVATALAFNGRPDELQPFAASSNASRQGAPALPAILYEDEQDAWRGDGDLSMSEDGDSVSGRSSAAATALTQASPRKRTADDVLAQAFMDGDDENDDTVAMQGSIGSIGANERSFRSIPAPHVASSGRTLGTRRPFGPTQTMPANLATARYLAEGDGASSHYEAGKLPAAAEAWRKINFDDFTKRDDF